MSYIPSHQPGNTSKPPSHPLHLTADTIGGDDPGPPPAGIYRGSNRLGRSRVTYLQPTGREIARSIPSSDPPSYTSLHAKWGEVVELVQRVEPRLGYSWRTVSFVRCFILPLFIRG